ncbi:MAG: retropepsin-like aspartic protease [Planctomycetota bacterium]
MTVFPFDGERGPIFVRASASGPIESAELLLLLDTGASMTSLRAETLIHLGYAPDHSDETVQIVSVNSVTQQAVVRINRLSALGVHRLGIPVVSQQFPDEIEFDGVIGLDFFRDRKLTIDFRAGQLTLE